MWRTNMRREEKRNGKKKREDKIRKEKRKGYNKGEMKAIKKGRERERERELLRGTETKSDIDRETFTKEIKSKTKINNHTTERE